MLSPQVGCVPFGVHCTGWRNRASSEVGKTVQTHGRFQGHWGVVFHTPLVVTLLAYLGLMPYVIPGNFFWCGSTKKDWRFSWLIVFFFTFAMMIKILPTQRKSSGSLFTQQQGKKLHMWPPQQCGSRAKKKNTNPVGSLMRPWRPKIAPVCPASPNCFIL